VNFKTLSISNITLSDEFALAAREFSLQPAKVWGLLLNAAQSMFGPGSLRRELTGSLQTAKFAAN
jgi:hypothetical protein